MRECHFRTRTYKPRAFPLVRSQSHVHSGSSPLKRLSQVDRSSTVDQPASDAEGRYVERGNVRRCGLCTRKITAIEDEGMMAKQWLGGVNCFGTGLRVCCLSAVAYCSGFVLSLHSFTHSLTHSLTAKPWNTPRSYWTALHLFFCQRLQRNKHGHPEALCVLAPSFLLPSFGSSTVVTHVLIPTRVAEIETLPNIHGIHTLVRTPSNYVQQHPSHGILSHNRNRPLHDPPYRNRLSPHEARRRLRDPRGRHHPPHPVRRGATRLHGLRHTQDLWIQKKP